MMKGMTKLLLGAVAGLTAAASSADTCFFIGRGASADGTTMIGRSVDSGAAFPARCRLAVTPRVENKSGRRHWGSDGFVWQFPATTCGCVSTPRMTSDKVGKSAAMAMNDCGLTVVALTTDAPQPEAKESISAISSGASEREYPLVIAQCSTNARQAVALVRRIVGSSGSGRANVVLVADRDEAWVVETHPGRTCEALRLPDDAFVSFGDSFTLRGFEPKAAGRTYALKDAFALLRERDGGPYPSVCHVLSVATNLPPRHAVTAWTSLGDAKASVFLPVSNAAQAFDERYAADDKGKADRTKFGEDCACDAFHRLQALAAQDPKLCGAGVRNYWEAREDELIAAWRKLLPAGNPRALADFTTREQVRALKDAARLSEEVIFAMARRQPFEASDFDRIALAQMQREGTVRYPVALEKGETDFSGVPKWAPKMDEWTDPALVAWGKPAAAGRKRVLVCVAHADTFAVQHLRNRLDVDCDILEGAFFNKDDPAWLAGLERVEHALASTDYDGFVFIGAGPAAWPTRLQRKLAELQLAGKGVALVNAGTWGGRSAPDPDFARGAPRAFEILVEDKRPDARAFDVVWTNATLPAVSRATLGAGRIVSLSLPRNVKDTYMTNPRFSPSWTMTPDRVFQDEYCYAYSCRAVMDALGMRGPATVTEIRRDAVTFASPSPFEGTAAVTVRDCWGRAVWEKAIPVRLAAGETKLPLALPELEPGYYGLDVILRTAKGSCDFATELFAVRPAADAPLIASAKLAKDCFPPDEDVVGEVRVANPAAGLMVTADVRDPRQRLVAKAAWPVDAATGVAKVVLKQDRLRLNCHFVQFTLVRDGKKLDIARTWFFRKVGDGERGDFRLYDSAGSHGGKDCGPRFAALDYNGMDILAGGNVQRLFYGCDAGIRERIPGKLSVWNGSISSPMWTNWLVSTYTKHAKSLAMCNGRVLSLGDDSNECTDFFEGNPDWAEPYFNALEKRLSAELVEMKGKNPSTRSEAAYAAWLTRHGLADRFKPSYSFYWGFRNPLVTKVGYKGMLAAMTEEDVPLLREAARRGYGDIRVFNAANRVQATSFETLDLATIRKLNPWSKPEFPYFLRWLADVRYGETAKLNAAWGTAFADIWAIDQEAFDRLLRANNVRAGVDRDRYLARTFLGNCKLIGQAVKSVDPSIAVGFGASWCGCELQEQFDSLSLSAPYANCCIAHTNRRLRRPGRYLGVCIGWYGWPIGWVDAEKVSRDRREKEGWDALVGGANFVWMWTACYGLNGARATPPSGYGWLFDTLGEINRGPAALLNRAKRDDSGIAILLSNDTMPLGRLEGRRGNLMAALFWGGAPGTIGLGYEFVTPRDLRTGELERRGTKLLVLPDVDYIDEPAAKAVREFVAKGGAVAANRESGMYEEFGAPRKASAFGDLFRDNPRAKVFAGKDPRKDYVEFVRSLGFVPTVRVFDAKGKRLDWGVGRFNRDNGEYAFSIGNNKGDGAKPVELFVGLDSPGAVYDVRTGARVLPAADGRYPITLKGLDTRVYSWQPYAAEKMEVAFDGKPVRGGTLKLRARLVTSPVSGAEKGAKVGTRVFRVEFLPPGGLRRTELAPIPRYLPDAPGGELSLDVPLAFDERGDLTVEVTDVATGVCARKALTLQDGDQM